MKVEYDIPIEVSHRAYVTIMNNLAGVCAGRVQGGKYFIKLWIMEYKHEVADIIRQNPL